MVSFKSITILSPYYLRILNLSATTIPVQSGTEVVVNTPSNVIKELPSQKQYQQTTSI